METSDNNGNDFGARYLQQIEQMKEIQRLLEMKKENETQKVEIEKELRLAMKYALELGVDRREVSVLVGVSKQRVHQMLVNL